jgi:hypothetical protein
MTVVMAAASRQYFSRTASSVWSMSMPLVASKSSTKTVFGSQDQLGQGVRRAAWGLVGAVGKLGCPCPAGNLAALVLGARCASHSLGQDNWLVVRRRWC